MLRRGRPSFELSRTEAASPTDESVAATAARISSHAVDTSSFSCRSTETTGSKKRITSERCIETRARSRPETSGPTNETNVSLSCVPIAAAKAPYATAPSSKAPSISTKPPSPDPSIASEVGDAYRTAVQFVAPPLFLMAATSGASSSGGAMPDECETVW